MTSGEQTESKKNVSTVVYCPSCGQRTKPDVRFCGSCGGVIAIEGQQPQGYSMSGASRHADNSSDKGAALEQAIAAFFASSGYTVTPNMVLEGTSGGKHEVDVLAE
jgi:hypothetical protein